MRVLASALIVSALAVTQAASFQTQRVAVTGTVVDPAGIPIPGVAIELRNASAVLQRTTSDAAGLWTFRTVAPGDYTIRHALAGFVTTEFRLTVGTGAPPPFRVVLKVGAVSDTVEVIGGSRSGEDFLRSGTGSGRGAGAAGGVPVGGVVGGVVGGMPPGLSGAGCGAIGPASRLAPGAYGLAPATTRRHAPSREQFRRVSEHPLSTFSIDVDSASYANVRRILNLGQLPRLTPSHRGADQLLPVRLSRPAR
jgi:hypothetical protein